MSTAYAAGERPPSAFQEPRKQAEKVEGGLGAQDCHLDTSQLHKAARPVSPRRPQTEPAGPGPMSPWSEKAPLDVTDG